MNPQPKTNATIYYVTLSDAVKALASTRNIQVTVAALRVRCLHGKIPGARRLPDARGVIAWHIPMIELESIEPTRPAARSQLSESELREARARGII